MLLTAPVELEMQGSVPTNLSNLDTLILGLVEEMFAAPSKNVLEM